MTRIWRGFGSYAVIAIANTLIHWQLFFILRMAFELSQACSNLLACCAAASFTFYANALYTFPKAPTVGRYAAFMLCLGGISLAVGALGDRWQWPGVLTVSVFSLISLVVGFLISKWLVFRVRTSASG